MSFIYRHKSRCASDCAVLVVLLERVLKKSPNRPGLKTRTPGALKIKTKPKISSHQAGLEPVIQIGGKTDIVFRYSLEGKLKKKDDH